MHGHHFCVLAALGLALSLGASACGEDGDGGPPGRGSAACQDWQDAVCDLAVDTCGSVDRATCDAQYKGVECLSDDQASACSNMFNAQAACTPPGNCDIADIADLGAANASCIQLFTALCEHDVRCGGSQTVAACLVDLDAEDGCAGAAAVDLRFEQCLETIEAAGCSDPAPTECENVIRSL